MGLIIKIGRAVCTGFKVLRYEHDCEMLRYWGLIVYGFIVRK